jgi:hypothetical protein
MSIERQDKFNGEAGGGPGLAAPSLPRGNCSTGGTPKSPSALLCPSCGSNAIVYRYDVKGNERGSCLPCGLRRYYDELILAELRDDMSTPC